MMSKTTVLALALLFAASIAAFASVQEIDLSGTWKGTTYIADRQMNDIMTLVLQKDDGSYEGTVTDEAGMADEAEISNVSFSGGVLEFDFTIFDGENYANVHVTLKMEGNNLAGSWVTDSGATGDIVLTKQTAG
jgi:hypothetical protein